MESSHTHQLPAPESARKPLKRGVQQHLQLPAHEGLNRIWFPDVDSNLSPQHGITVCCGRAGERARSHGPTMGYRDVHQESADGQGAVWNSYLSHVPQYESLASAFYCTMDHWVGYTTDAIPRSTIDPILTSYKVLCSQYQAGPHAWRLPPHTLAYNLYTLVFSMYALDSLLLEGFGAGAYNAAVRH